MYVSSTWSRSSAGEISAHERTLQLPELSRIVRKSSSSLLGSSSMMGPTYEENKRTEPVAEVMVVEAALEEAPLLELPAFCVSST
jgi:hypothetical protein